eukprot:2677446-Prymnesium_polylepis.1
MPCPQGLPWDWVAWGWAARPWEAWGWARGRRAALSTAARLSWSRWAARWAEASSGEAPWRCAASASLASA